MGTIDHNKIKAVKSLILFDGVCHFCNNVVNFVIDRDPEKKFVFAALQSDYARERLAELGEYNVSVYTVILIRNKKIYKRSRAALEIAKGLSGLWPVYYIAIIIPGFIRDVVYNFIAKNRYKWFGKMEACCIPTPEMRERFL